MPTRPVDLVALAKHLSEQVRISRLLTPYLETPVHGPWKILDSGQANYICVGINPACNPHVHIMPIRFSHQSEQNSTIHPSEKEQVLAHAYLISAAPEILEALIKLVSIAGLPHHPVTRQALAAIAKARGM